MASASDHIASLPLVQALWWFIENVPPAGNDRNDMFFALRERVREHSATNDVVANALRYDTELNALELPPNGDDYNNIYDMLRGHPYSPPHTDGR